MGLPAELAGLPGPDLAARRALVQVGLRVLVRAALRALVQVGLRVLVRVALRAPVLADPRAGRRPEAAPPVRVPAALADPRAPGPAGLRLERAGRAHPELRPVARPQAPRPRTA